MNVGVVADDLITLSRIAAIAERAGAEVVRLDRPADMPAGTDLLLVDWANRDDPWTDELHQLRAAVAAPRIILFGPHRDIEAHQAARDAGVGPMLARSKLFDSLPAMLGQPDSPSSSDRP